MLESLREEHRVRTGATPDDQQEAALIETWHGEEALYREALALGLDRGDPVVRRRLVQKMRFLVEDAPVSGEPPEGEHEAWFSEHASDYVQPERVALRHVFVPARDEAARAEAQRLLGLLENSADPGPLGSPFLQGRVFGPTTSEGLVRVFGPEFAQAVMDLPAGRWSGPLPSSYGLHLVHVDSSQPRREPVLDEVRGDVRRDWERDRRENLDREATSRLRERYPLVREEPE